MWSRTLGGAKGGEVRLHEVDAGVAVGDEGPLEVLGPRHEQPVVARHRVLAAHRLQPRPVQPVRRERRRVGVADVVGGIRDRHPRQRQHHVEDRRRRRVLRRKHPHLPAHAQASPPPPPSAAAHATLVALDPTCTHAVICPPRVWLQACQAAAFQMACQSVAGQVSCQAAAFQMACQSVAGQVSCRVARSQRDTRLQRGFSSESVVSGRQVACVGAVRSVGDASLIRVTRLPSESWAASVRVKDVAASLLCLIAPEGQQGRHGGRASWTRVTRLPSESSEE